MRPKSLLLVFGGVMGMLGCGYGVLFTMLDDYRDEYGISESLLGVVIGVGFLSGFVSQVLLAPLADRGHAKQVVLAGMLLNVAGLTGMALATSFLPLFLGRLVMGIGVGMAFPAIRRIVIIAEPERLGHNIGRLLAADVGGFALGPAISAALVGPFGIPAPFLVITTATVIALPFVARVPVAEAVAPPAQRFAFDLLRLRPFTGAVILASAVFLMIGAFDVLWAVVLDDLDTNEWIANLGITLFALPLILLGSVGGRLAQRVGPFKVATAGLLGGALFMLLYGLVPSGGAMFAVAMVHSVNDGLTVSSTGVAVGMVVPGERQAGAQGVLGGFETLTAGITALVTGALYDHAGRTTAYGVTAAAMVTLVVIGVLLSRSAWHLRGAPKAELAPVAS